MTAEKRKPRIQLSVPCDGCDTTGTVDLVEYAEHCAATMGSIPGPAVSVLSCLALTPGGWAQINYWKGIECGVLRLCGACFKKEKARWADLLTSR